MISLATLTESDIPIEFLPNSYFDFKQHPSIHTDLFENKSVHTVFDALKQIGPYTRQWLRTHYHNISTQPPLENYTSKHIIVYTFPSKTPSVESAPSLGHHPTRAGTASSVPGVCLGAFKLLVEAGAVFR